MLRQWTIDLYVLFSVVCIVAAWMLREATPWIRKATGEKTEVLDVVATTLGILGVGFFVVAFTEVKCGW